MKKILAIFSLLLLLTACSGDGNEIRRNPNLVDLNIRLQLNLNFQEYNDLQFAGNSFSTYTNGVRGIVVYNINNNQYVAFELSDPNHPPSSCSGMTVNGVIATCECENNEYNIITGQLTTGEGQYGMKPYRVTKRGNILEITN